MLKEQEQGVEREGPRGELSVGHRVRRDLGKAKDRKKEDRKGCRRSSGSEEGKSAITGIFVIRHLVWEFSDIGNQGRRKFPAGRKKAFGKKGDGERGRKYS